MMFGENKKHKCGILRILSSSLSFSLFLRAVDEFLLDELHSLYAYELLIHWLYNPELVDPSTVIEGSDREPDLSP